jgi:hypothetical protein
MNAPSLLPVYPSVARKLKRTDVVLEVGQIWRLPQGYVEIVQLGKTLAHYRRPRTEGQRGVSVSLAPITAVAAMLRDNDAELVKSPRKPSAT